MPYECDHMVGGKGNPKLTNCYIPAGQRTDKKRTLGHTRKIVNVREHRRKC